MSSDLAKLAAEIAKSGNGTAGLGVRKGVIQSIQSGTPPTATVAISNKPTPGVRFLRSASVVVGETVLMLSVGSEYVIVDSYRSTNAMRGPLEHRIHDGADVTVNGVGQNFKNYTFTPKTLCHPKISLGFLWGTDAGASGRDVEPARVTFYYEIRRNSDNALIYTSPVDFWHAAPGGNSSWSYVTTDYVTVVDVSTAAVQPGVAYTYKFIATNVVTLWTYCHRVVGTITEGGLIT